MSYTIGLDCEVIINNQGFFVQPGTYHMKQPRTRKATIRADNNEAYVDLGPGKREWLMNLLCLNDLNKYDGTSTGVDGQSYRDAIYGAYTGSIAATVPYTDPYGDIINVHIDSYVEQIIDMHIQQWNRALGSYIRLSYIVAIVLVEA